MFPWPQYGAAAALAVFCLLVAVHTLSRRRTARHWARAGQGLSPQPPGAGLPLIVRDFALRAGALPRPGDLSVTLQQNAELRLARGGLFVPMKARQIISLGEPGFVWQARQGLGPFTRLKVEDAFVGGEGTLEARLFGVITLARRKGVEVTLGEAYRYLAELPLAPDAILGNPALEWRETGAQEVEVKLNTRVGTARVTFRFDQAGDIVEMEARSRPATDPEGKPVRYDWRGRFGEYAKIGARRLPGYCEVGYDYPGGHEVYFRARMTGCRVGP